jgi:putative PIN family toxin of toxin-antitoxin system
VKILIDTNVLLAAVITHGVCYEALEHCLKEHTVFSSPQIVLEFKRILQEKIGLSVQETAEAERMVFRKICQVLPVEIPPATLKDKNDLHVLGAALAVPCELLVTGDKELLSLKSFQHIRIIPPVAIWQYAG